MCKENSLFDYLLSKQLHVRRIHIFSPSALLYFTQVYTLDNECHTYYRFIQVNYCAH